MKWKVRTGRSTMTDVVAWRRCVQVRCGIGSFHCKTLTAAKDKSAATTTLRYSVFLKLHLLSVPDVSDTADYSWWVAELYMSSRTRSSSSHAKHAAPSLQCSDSNVRNPPGAHQHASSTIEKGPEQRRRRRGPGSETLSGGDWAH